MAEFTGERLIPGKVDVDLLNEHRARYAFAVRLAGGKRVLDAGCGAGYGAADLAAVARRVVGADIAPEAVEFARENYRLPNLQFEQASCTALPHANGSFDLIVAFEVIEHLENWRGLLLEARRLLSPGGQFVVSTPNRLYYTESRGAQGANPFHVHEFDCEEFRAELAAVFPDVAMFFENHTEGVVFQPHQQSGGAEVCVENGTAPPDQSHFFVAVCADRPQIGKPTFVYVPRAANVLRERERHIGVLLDELEIKKQWIEERDARIGQLQSEVEAANQWAANTDQEIQRERAAFAAMQEELTRTVAAYRKRVGELEHEVEELAQWGKNTEALLEERTAWANRLQEQVNGYRGSRWVKLGRSIGLGPQQPAT